MRECTTKPREHKRMRLVAGRPEAMALAGPPAEGATEKQMTVFDGVASKPIIDTHQAEEFVSQDVVLGE